MQIERNQILGIAVGAAGAAFGVAFMVTNMPGGRALTAASAVLIITAIYNWKGPHA